MDLKNAGSHIHTKEALSEEIARLEQLKKRQEQELKQQFQVTKASFQPGNLVKSALGNFGVPGHVGSLLLKAGGGIAAGLLTKNLISGKAGATVSSLLSNAAKTGAVTVVANYADKILAYATSIYHNLFSKKKKKEYQED